MAAWTAWSFRGFSCCLKCSKLCNWYFQRWNCESSDRRTKESNLFCFIGPRYICLPSNYGKSLNYQVAPAKTGLISRGENHLLSWQFLHMRDRKRVRLGRGLFSQPSTNRDLCQQGISKGKLRKTFLKRKVPLQSILPDSARFRLNSTLSSEAGE
jgi:hypothetical protein